MKKIIANLLILSILILPNTAKASSEIHDVLKSLKTMHEFEIEPIGRAYGMDGWALIKGDKVEFAYTTPEGGIIMGALFGPDGDSVTAKQLEQYRNKKDADEIPGVSAEQVKNSPKAEQFYQESEKANWFKLGKDDAPYIYVYMNAECVHCHEYWNKLASHVEEGTLQVRIIPFGNLDLNKENGSALLGMGDKAAAAWIKRAKGDASLIDKAQATPANLAKIKQNQDLAVKWNLQSTPFTIYRSPQGSKIKVVLGQPDNILLLLSEFL